MLVVVFVFVGEVVVVVVAVVVKGSEVWNLACVVWTGKWKVKEKPGHERREQRPAGRVETEVTNERWYLKRKEDAVLERRLAIEGL